MFELTKFNDLYNKIIFESTQFENNFIQQINNSDAFFRSYIEPLADKFNILAEKQRYNTFRLFGKINDLFKFLNSFIIDKEFCKDINNKEFIFQVLSPMISLCNITHIYNNGKIAHLFNRTASEDQYLINAGQKIPTTRSNDDLSQEKIEGRWYRLFDNTQVNPNVPDFNVPKEVHSCTPKELVKIIKKFLKANLNTTKFDDNYGLYIEFMVNCDKLPNNCYGELAKQVPITFSGTNNKVLDVSDIMNDPKKMFVPTATSTLPKSIEQPLVGETKTKLRKSKSISYNDKNKVKTKKV